MKLNIVSNKTTMKNVYDFRRSINCFLVYPMEYGEKHWILALRKALDSSIFHYFKSFGYLFNYHLGKFMLQRIVMGMDFGILL